MRSKGREKSREGVLNTPKDKQTGEMTVDVTVLLSDYAKIRALARESGKRPMEVLKDIICGGVRHLAGVSSMALVATMVIFSSMPAHAGLFSSGAGDAGHIAFWPTLSFCDGSFIRHCEGILFPRNLIAKNNGERRNEDMYSSIIQGKGACYGMGNK